LRTTAKKPRRSPARASLSTLIALFVLVAGVQALGPAQAAAMTAQESEACMYYGGQVVSTSAGSKCMRDGNELYVSSGAAPSQPLSLPSGQDEGRLRISPDEDGGGSRGGGLRKSNGMKPTKPGLKNPSEKDAPDPLKQCLALQNQQVDALAALAAQEARMASIWEQYRTLQDARSWRNELGEFSSKLDTLSGKVDDFLDRHPWVKSGLDLGLDTGGLMGSMALYSFERSMAAAKLLRMARLGSSAGRLAKAWPLLVVAIVWAEYEYEKVSREHTFRRAELWEEIRALEDELSGLDLGAETKAMATKIGDLARVEKKWMQLGCWGIMPPDTGHL
jgi:hypothetical protein